MKKALLLISIITFVGCGKAASVLTLIPNLNEDAGDVSTSDTGSADVVPTDDVTPDAVSDSGADSGTDALIGPDLGALLSIEEELDAIVNLTSYQEVEQRDGFRWFELNFTHPLDHFNDDGRSFTQTAYLLFKNSNAPTVLMTTGYGLGDRQEYYGFITEPTQLLDANQIILGHRFFTNAIPDPADQDWSKVDIAQSAADTHAIRQGLRSALRGKWIGTGWSKGGMTQIFQEYFYPDDIDLSIPMVAPISFSPQDPRYPTFTATIGTPDCRQRLFDTAVGALNRTEELVDLYDPPQNQRPQFRAQVRSAVAKFNWGYWQFLGDSTCNRIPGPDASANVLVNFFFAYRLPSGPTIELPRPITPEEAQLGAYSYQAGTQLGYQDANFAGHLQALVDQGVISNGEKQNYELPFHEYYQGQPWDNQPPFDFQPMIDVDAWLRADAKDMLAVYGEWDPWSGGMVTLNSANSSKVYVAPRANHGAFLQNLSNADYNEITNRILEQQSGQFRIDGKIQKPEFNPEMAAQLRSLLIRRLL